jgi:hypothetical protein
MLTSLMGFYLSAYQYRRTCKTYTLNLLLSPWKGEGTATLKYPFLSRITSSLGVVVALVMAVIVLSVSVGVRLKARFFPEGVIVVYSVLFLTLERG